MGELISQAELHEITRLDDTVRTSRHALDEAERNGNVILKGMILARATQTVRGLLTGAMMTDIRALANTPLGFRTDKDYPDEVLRDVAIVAMLDGARIVGNEFNVIAGNYYRTKEQLERRIREYPGLTRFRYDLGVPVLQGSGALVSANASWKLNGTADQIACEQGTRSDTRLPIKVNSGMGVDAILGKARRKLFYRVLERLTGTQLEEDEPEAVDGEVVKPVDEAKQAADERCDLLNGFGEKFANAQNNKDLKEISRSAAQHEWTPEERANLEAWYREALDRLGGRKKVDSELF